MITPLDLTNKEFKKTVFGGYKEDDVKEFFDRVIEDYEKLYKENIELKDKINVLNESIQHYRTIEETLQNTMVTAQQTGEDIKRIAQDKAENIIKQAEINASKIVADANEQATHIKFEYQEELKKYKVFIKKIEMLLTSQLQLIKETEKDITK